MAVFCVRVLQHVFRLIREYFPHFVHRHEAWEGEEREGERERKRHPACFDDNTPDGALHFDRNGEENTASMPARPFLNDRACITSYSSRADFPPQPDTY